MNLFGLIVTQICNWKKWEKKYYAYISALVAIPNREQLCVCVCGCYARDEVSSFFLVNRETALFRQAILRVLTKKHGCTPFTLCSHRTCGCIQNPGFRIQPHACGWMVKTHTCSGGSRGGGGLGGLNHPPPPLGLPSKNLMCIEKCHHNMSRPTQYVPIALCLRLSLRK